MRERNGLQWNALLVDEWLKRGPVSRIGRCPRWAQLIHGEVNAG
jgi:hypothetical protein